MKKNLLIELKRFHRKDARTCEVTLTVHDRTVQREESADETASAKPERAKPCTKTDRHQQAL